MLLAAAAIATWPYLPERCGPGLIRQAADGEPCQPPQVLHRGCKVELLGRALQSVSADTGPREDVNIQCVTALIGR